MQWNNELQKAIIQEWTEGAQKANGPKALQTLRKRIASKYGLGIYHVQGIIELGASEGMVIVGTGRGKEMQGGRKYRPINYHEFNADLKQRIETLERKFNFLLDGVQKVLEDGETMRVHVQQLRGMTKWMRKRESIDIEQKARVIGLEKKEGSEDG